MYRPLGRIFICRVCNHPLDYAFATIDQNYRRSMNCAIWLKFSY